MLFKEAPDFLMSLSLFSHYVPDKVVDGIIFVAPIVFIVMIDFNER